MEWIEMSTGEDDPGGRPMIPVRPKLIRKSVSLDRDRAELRVGEGPPIPFSEAEAVVFRRRVQIAAAWWQNPDPWGGEKKSEWVYEVYVRSGERRTIVAEFRTRSGAERCANELREEISSVGDHSF